MVPVGDAGVHVGVQVGLGGLRRGVVRRRHAEYREMFSGDLRGAVVVQVAPFRWHNVVL